MAQRLTKTTTKLLRAALAHFMGYFCQACRAEQVDLADPLEIDHVDNDRHNWSMSNLQLLCKSCNVTKRNQFAAGRTTRVEQVIYPAENRPQLQSRTPILPAENPNVPPRNGVGSTSPHRATIPTPNKERERDSRFLCACDLIPDPHYQGEHPQVRKELANYPNGSTEHQANFFFHTDYLAWLYSYIAEHGFISTTQAVDAGAMATGGNVQTIGKYLRPLKSFLGPLQETEDMIGQKVLVFKEGVNLQSLVPELRSRNGAHAEGQSEPPPTADPRSSGASAEGQSDARGLR